MAKHTTHRKRLLTKQVASDAKTTEGMEKPQSEGGANKDHKEDFETLLDDAALKPHEKHK